MIVGVCKITLRLPGNRSLKGKRHVVKSIIGRVQHQFNVAIAEVDYLDRWQLAALGVACVSNSGQHAREVLDRVVAFVEHNLLEGELTDYEIELVSA